MSLRVLHVVDSLAPDAGAVAVALPGLFAALRHRGVESTTITGDEPKDGRGLPVRCPQTDPPVRYTQTGTASPGHAEASPCRGRKALDDIVAGADVLHLHGFNYDLARTAAAACVRASKRFVLSPHGALGPGSADRATWGRKLRGFLRGGRVVRGATVVAAVNEPEHKDLERRHLKGRVVRLPYGIDTGEYDGVPPGATDPPALPEGRCLLMLGPIDPREGCVALLKSMSELGSVADGWSLVLAGREIGVWRRELEAALRRKGGDGRVVFAPAPDVTTQRMWLGRASILASPSLHIGCGVAIMQAAASSVPVLASVLAAPPELLEVIQTCGPARHTLVRSLRQLLEMSEEERAGLARQAWERVRSRLDWSTLVDQYLRLYESLV